MRLASRDCSVHTCSTLAAVRALGALRHEGGRQAVLVDGLWPAAGSACVIQDKPVRCCIVCNSELRYRGVLCENGDVAVAVDGPAMGSIYKEASPK